MHNKTQYKHYAALMRLDRPIGTLLLLWPTLSALWLAAGEIPDIHLLVIFCVGTFLMRSAGCVINDLADRRIDPHVKRTAQRPLATGAVSVQQAIGLFITLSLLAFVLVLFTNRLTILLALVAVLLAACYPFAKRYTHFPQVVLGVAFSFGIPMAFAAQSNALPAILWLLFIANVLWTVVYDTFYAMVDRDDDIVIGVKSTAVLFDRWDRLITACLQVVVIISFIVVGIWFALSYPYYISLVIVALLFIYQQYLIKQRDRDRCLRAFLNNQWVGAVVWLGIVLAYG
jgi:4-hydroxybenzoate polyprenyltransferase